MVKDVNAELVESDDEPDLKEGFFMVPELTLTMLMKCKKPHKEKILVFDYRSLYLFDHRTMFR